MRKFRCTNGNCSEDKAGRNIFDFVSESEVGVCPKCGISSTDSRFGHIIVPLVVIHYDPPSHVKGHGLNVRACDPKTSIREGRGTAEPTAVTCDACRDTEVWKLMLNKSKEDADYDFAASKDFRVEIDRSKGVIVRVEG